MFVDVVLPMPVDQAFTYAVPAALRSQAQAGMRAIVPVRDRMDTGFVVAVRDTCDLEKTRQVVTFPDPEPILTPAMLELCRWIANYYCCSWGESLQSAIPAGIRIGSELRYALAPVLPDNGRYSDAQRAIVAALYKSGPMTARQLAKATEMASVPSAVRGLITRGLVVAEVTQRAAATKVRTEMYVEALADAMPQGDALAKWQRKAPKQAAVALDALYTGDLLPAATLCERHGATMGTLKTLAAKGYIRLETRERYRQPKSASLAHGGSKHVLNAEQQAAYNAATSELEAGRFASILLHGVTGSGKTEVYLQIIERALALGRDAIMLVPEISLTPQTVGRFYARFREAIAVLHSALSPGERYDEWRKAHRGEVRIVVGARSAIFAPLPNVGVIVVDEEHDGSYKQSEVPRYHARDVALVRAKRANAVCILGSATPSLESVYNVSRGKSHLLELHTRATSAPMPQVHIVDMRREKQELAGEVVLSRKLEEAVHERIDAGEQTILLLNRRGFAPYVLCPSCSWVAECEDCQVSLTYHDRSSDLRCHYCNTRVPKPTVCAQCGFETLFYLGMGTQKAEDYLMRTFAGARIERMDADTTSGQGGHAGILARFARREIDILIGTQMLAKGHDYPGVTLAGVINADTGLCVPDFRAAEMTFQLLTQVAGRAGRAGGRGRPGEVILQTFRPNHYAIRAAAGHDFAQFVDAELGFRESAGYPPTRRMASILVECEEPEQASRAAVRIRSLAREAIEAQGLEGRVSVLGPAPMAVKRIKRRYRWHLGLLAGSPALLNAICRSVREVFPGDPAAKGVAIKVDIDPYGVF